MRKFKGTKMGKRILSVALAVGMVLAMLPIADRGMVSQADETYKSLKNYTSGGKEVVRGVVTSIDELPQSKNPNWEKEKVGTAKRPFTILEIVPYDEYAEFGYLIDGCEPLNIEGIHGDSGAINYVAAFNGADVKQVTDNIFFFTDEREGQKDYYGSVADADWAAKGYVNGDTEAKKRYQETVQGYYEVVDKSQGTFWIKEDAEGKKTIVKIEQYASEKPGEDAVYLRWHSLHSNVNGYGDLSKMSFNQSLATTSLEKIGDKLYTTRKSTDEDYVVNVSALYYSYVNKDAFLYDTIGLTKEEADTYSVVIKTITPDALNKDNSWVDYADLIYISSACHGGNKFDAWNSYRRFGSEAAATHPGSGDRSPFLSNDLSWNTVKKIVDKNTKVSNYAALLIDNTLYDSLRKDAKSASFVFYDFNLEPVMIKKVTSNGAWDEASKKNVDVVSYETAVSNADGVDNNLYKLMIMTVAQNPIMVKQIFWSHLSADRPDDPTSKIKLDLQTGLAETYWADFVFQLIDGEVFNNYNVSKYGGNQPITTYLADADITGGLWDAYNYSSNFHTNRYYVQNRAYTYNGDTSIAQQFRTGKTGCDVNMFKDFDHYVKTDEETIEIQKRLGKSGDMTAETAPPSAALRYVLGLGKDVDTFYGGTLRVLDVEPAVGVTKDYKSDWQIKESYIRMLVPNFTGTIEITHMTMSSFVGRTNDLNSDYDLIYFGSDSNAFWKSKYDAGKTDFYDAGMDGWIYFHIGDLSIASGYDNGYGVRTGNFIAGVSNNSLRFPGNDITKDKIEDLKAFMEAGFPIVADSALSNAAKMDPSSNICQFLKTYDADSTAAADTAKGVYDIWQTDAIEQCVRSVMIDVDFTKTPTKYEYTKAGNTYKGTYLDGNNSYANMEFGFEIHNMEEEYSYRIYVDQNRNGKFEGEEIVQESKASQSNDIKYSIAKTMVGLVQWRIEVFKTANPAVRASREGCSAIECTDDSKKEQIKVLQIAPSDTGNYADLTSSAYTDLYKDLDAFDISVDLITWQQFENYFVDSGFKFDMGKSIALSEDAAVKNPVNKKEAESIYKSDGVTKKDVGNGKDLSEYNMLIIGFQDAYGNVDLSDKNGAAEYLYYFAMDGGSILFTHDNTSLYNVAHDPLNTSNVAGYTANALLRDIMGMNRYGVNNTNLNSLRSGVDLAEALTNYRNNRIANGLLYDTTDKAQKQAYTMNAMRRMGTRYANTEGYRLPYRYMVLDAADESQYVGVDTGREGDTGKTTGLDESLCETNLAVRMNVGQITEYPYNIPENLPIATTHAQWYQLNMEDPEVTVWYTLEYPATFGSTAGSNATAKALAASPQDAANNYYIYSKGNIFYSGVGHSSTTDAGSSELERMLFVNTMIAAYRARYAAPTVEVTNPEASKLGADAYALRIPREFNYNGSSYTVEDLGDNQVKVTFRPIDSSFSNKIKCRIYFSDIAASNINSGNSIGTIYDAETDAAMNADGSDGFYIPNLKHFHEYYFYYDKSNLAAHPQLTFEVKNDRKDESGFATLKILAQPLFKLD